MAGGIFSVHEIWTALRHEVEVKNLSIAKGDAGREKKRDSRVRD